MSKELDCSFNIQTTDILLSHFLNNQTSADDTVWIQVNVFVNEVTRISLFLFLARFFLETTLCWLFLWLSHWSDIFFVCLWQCLCYCCCCSTNQNSRSHDCYIQMFSWCLFLEIPPACCVSLVQCVIVSIIVVCVCVWVLVLVLSHIVFFTPYINCYVFDLFNIFIRIMFIFFL